jgi:hypothetical protein
MSREKKKKKEHNCDWFERKEVEDYVIYAFLNLLFS